MTDKHMKNIDTLKKVEEGIWADLEIGESPRFLPGHAVACFRESLLAELSAIVGVREFERCAIRASADAHNGVRR